MKQKLTISSEPLRHRAIEIIRALPLDVAHDLDIREHKTTRNLEQNARMWAMLTDISEQVDWYGQRLTKEDWKDVFTASLKRLKVVPGIDGGFVVIGAHTSKMSVSEMSELIEFAMAFGCQHNVKWRDYE
ncbi:recombination protein NinB [Oryzomonas sagensis]|uniref:Recombination protein NinB n=1 Tax=Oryzomonas sagensis TaxID=2603857 RepID=A0ABQ6TLA7_9BACT|nr:recombination protein NinB [Oryzomonas sagensis]KAB0668966.1 recombination protein NinB [Oryzomonas sagensis]